VDQAFEQSLTKKYIKSRFRTIGVWPINLKAMDSKTRPLEVYTIAANINNAKSEEDYTTEGEAENNQQWGEDFVAVEFFHIGETIQHPTFKNLPLYMLKKNQRYYVDTP